MFRTNRTFLTLVFSVILMTLCKTTVYAKSVYAIPQHWGQAKLDVYDILEDDQEGKLEFRADYDLNFSGAADVTIDTRSDILFVTFESKNEVELIDARTFLSLDTVEADEATDLAGIVFSYIDPNTTHVFTVDRGKKKLYAYAWDADNTSLTPITPDPNDPTNPNYGEDDHIFCWSRAIRM